MNYIRTFFSYDFLFYVNPIRLEPVDQVFGLLAVACIFLAIVFKVRERLVKNVISKKFSRRFVRLLSTVGLLGLLWYGLRYQHVNFLSSHFIFVLILLIGVLWFGYIVKYWWRKYKVERVAWEKEQVKLKYLHQ